MKLCLLAALLPALPFGGESGDVVHVGIISSSDEDRPFLQPMLTPSGAVERARRDTGACG